MIMNHVTRFDRRSNHNPEDYPITVSRLQTGEGFYAEVLDLPGCASDGATQNEAIANAVGAIICWIETAEEMGRPIPEPTIRRAFA